jgi:uncharacterized MAPEG superfamily protein
MEMKMGTYGTALISAVVLFFVVLAVKVAYFRFVVQKMLAASHTDWRSETGMWNETKQLHALAKADPSAQTERRTAKVLFQAAIILFAAATGLLLVGGILGL